MNHFAELSFFLYRSSAKQDFGNSELTRILSVARDRNGSIGVTGCLHYEDGLFFQWLEGPPDAVKDVVNSILGDERHHGVTVLDEGPLAMRQFQEWTMRYSGRDQRSLMDWFAAENVSTVDRNEYAGGVLAFLQSVS